jgi:alpha-1,2-mannosyltransferase
MDELQRVGRRLLIAWCATSVIALTALAIGLASRGAGFFRSFQGPADDSLVEVKFLAFAIAWLWLGLALALTLAPALLARHWAILVVWGLLGLGYLNVVRGPHKVEHKDFSNYFTAALHMRAGQPLTDDPFQLYLYPPLLATLIEPVVPLGLGPASWLFRFGNYAALVLLVVLLYAALQRLGAGRLLAATLVLLALAFNVPVADTLAAQQINLYVANLVLAGLLLFPRHVALSAVAVALGAHLKVYPVLLALPFVFLRQWRWCAWFVATTVGVVVATSAINSFDYYAQFLRQLAGLQEYGIRNASVAALLHNTTRFAGVSLGQMERPLATLLQLGCATLAGWWGWRPAREGLLVQTGERSERVAGSAIVVLSLVMLVGSPSVWPHHLVLALLPALALVLAVRSITDAALLAVAWFLVFLVPVHEVFPFAYLRLLGLMVFALLFRHVAHDAAAGKPSLLLLLQSRLGLRPSSGVEVTAAG